jgi:hypothetical protein
MINQSSCGLAAIHAKRVIYQVIPQQHIADAFQLQHAGAYAGKSTSTELTASQSSGHPRGALRGPGKALRRPLWFRRNSFR